ncbi:MAG: formimidoylglutamase [Chitinophagales bacterium]|nr:formimidoylglutamase [Chitinophagales bacterium]HMV15404.1 formimidoylglutamase [Chitinophagales bacterium]HMW12054.1 formimidoylglutamase [Chitinophagales bacterium]HMX59471.1 formimidoylglutamase [Chitinophagales bacterium]HMY23665.1 formimidoylglutamase [Chitinophagales bacterium]
MQNFVFYKKENAFAFIKKRNGETKLGEKIRAISNQKNWKNELKKSSAPFVIIGIPEDIGVKANFGVGGAHTVWKPFLQAFFNIHDNQFLSGDSFLLLGEFDFSDLQQKIKNKPIEFVREQVEVIDKQVAQIIQAITEAGKTPIIIGGGHNNAYGNIKGTALGLQQNGKIKNAKINAINIDAHADFRALEGRHSGNGFSYAMHDGYLDKYSIIGLHENYTSQAMLENLNKNKKIQTHFFEDICIRKKIEFDDVIQDAILFTKNSYTGIEIDIDAIENTLSSAISPCGFSSQQIRQFIHQVASKSKIAYLHICEGATTLDNGLQSTTTGKLIAYIVSDFAKSIR